VQIPQHLRVLYRARIARVATVDSDSKPHLIPVVFVFCNYFFYLPIDNKSKRARPEKLKRTKTIQQNSNVALLIDGYSENWKELFFILIQGGLYFG
jgi:nitroimidazol reductase NimA-like FMN-containing flavoprotein (pyridoxamine 5'-phosphate oxidase superfamily)